jgi:hypothetical protein
MDIKKAQAPFTAHQAAVGARTLKTGQSRWFIGYKKHTLRLWFAPYEDAVLLLPLCSWAVPANRGEALFLYPSLRDCLRRLHWLPKYVVGDMAYINLANQRRIREELDVAIVTKLRPDMHLVEPYTGQGVPHCHQGQALRWLHYDSDHGEQWFGVQGAAELCRWCWEQSTCSREFSYPAATHEILLGQVPYNSWLARHLLERVRPWVEPAQSFEKNQLGLRSFYLNSLQYTWVMCLLADMTVLLRAHALLHLPLASASPSAHFPLPTTFPW